MSIDRVERLEQFRKSEASNLKAEVFLDELQFIMGEDILNQVVVNNQGMNERILSKDVVEATFQHTALSGEKMVLRLARNSIYHQLPEILFHPLSLTKPNMSVAELVEAIRANRMRAAESIKFFAPFDTAFFKERVLVHQRHLNLFANSDTHKSLRTVIDAVLSDELALTGHQRYKLFLFLCQAERYKEVLPQIAELVKEVMGLGVCLEFIPHIIEQLPYPALGEATLGINMGLYGAIEAELEDLRATLLYEESIPTPDVVAEHRTTLEAILHFFILSGRQIEVQYTLLGRVNFILGENRLGYDTHI